jgi:hypothetical protein
VDVNPAYVQQVQARFHDRIPDLELVVGDVQTEGVTFPSVDLLFLGLVLEYVDVEVVLRRTRSLLREGGVLGTVVQLPCLGLAEVTPSPFASLQSLGGFMRLVQPGYLKNLADEYGYQEIASSLHQASGGKQFRVQEFR